MHRFVPAAVLALALGVVACRDEAAEAPAAAPAAAVAPTQTAPDAPATTGDAGAAVDEPAQPDWDAAAVAKIEALVEKLRAAGVPCDEIEWLGPGMYLQHLREVLHVSDEQLPIAEGYCTSDQEEDLTFTVFRAPEHAKTFVERKQQFLCRRAAKTQLWEFPGFPYVLNENWVLTPDERTTSVRLADILGGTADMAACNLNKPTPTP